MAKASSVRARVDDNLKTDVENIFSELGLTMSQAITLFLRQCAINRGLPFEVRLPNKETVNAMREAEEIAKNPEASFDSAEAMFKEPGTFNGRL